MYGAILGDIIGSSYEFSSNNAPDKDFSLFTKDSQFTDATVMMCAIADTVMNQKTEATGQELREEFMKNMKAFAQEYPLAGYGRDFLEWLFSVEESKPFEADGNIGAVRCIPLAWMLPDFRAVYRLSGALAALTSSGTQGLLGAMALTAMISLAKNKGTKEQLRYTAEHAFGYDLSKSIEELRADFSYSETCAVTVPAAITAALEANSYEEAVRNAVYLGGNSDTLTAMTGGIAEALYGVPEELKDRIFDYIPDSLKHVLTQYDAFLAEAARKREEELKALNDAPLPVNPQRNTAVGNSGQTGEEQIRALKSPELAGLEEAIRSLSQVNAKQDRAEYGKRYTACMRELDAAVKKSAMVYVPAGADPKRLNPQGKPMLVIQFVRLPDGSLWEAVFTSGDKLVEHQNATKGAKGALGLRLGEALLNFTNLAEPGHRVPDEVKGILINPGKETMVLAREIIPNLITIRGALKEKTETAKA